MSAAGAEEADAIVGVGAGAPGAVVDDPLQRAGGGLSQRVSGRLVASAGQGMAACRVVARIGFLAEGLRRDDMAGRAGMQVGSGFEPGGGAEAGRRGGRDRGRVDGDRQLDVPAQLPGQRVGDQCAQPGFQLFLDELVGRGDQRGVLYQAKRPGELQPGPVRGLDLHAGQLVQRPGPNFREVCFTHWPSTSRPHI
jgi:hypothetical protein